MTHDQVRTAIDTILEYIEELTASDERKVDELAFEYLDSVAHRKDYVESSELARLFCARFCLWVGATTALQALRCDDHMHSRAVDVATTHLQLPPRPPPGTRRAA